jgi:DNA-binding response OmpR family regulator
MQIAVIDDDQSMSRMLSRALKVAGFEVSCFGSAEQFLTCSEAHDFDSLILDMNLPGMSGIELQQEMIRQGSEVPIILISADANEATQQRGLRAGAIDFFSKPFRIDTLISRLRSVSTLLLA